MGGWDWARRSTESLWEQLQPAAAAASSKQQAAKTWPEQQAGFLAVIFETFDQSDDMTID